MADFVGYYEDPTGDNMATVCIDTECADTSYTKYFYELGSTAFNFQGVVFIVMCVPGFVRSGPIEPHEAADV